MKVVSSRNRNKNHIVIVIKGGKGREKIKKEFRKAIRKMNCLSEEEFSFEIYF